MALRDLFTRHIISFRACRDALADGELVMKERTDGNVTAASLDLNCPRHDTTECYETYYAVEYLRSWSVWDFLRKRRQWRWAATYEQRMRGRA